MTEYIFHLSRFTPNTKNGILWYSAVRKRKLKKPVNLNYLNYNNNSTNESITNKYLNKKTNE